MPNLGAMVQAAYTAYCCGENVTAEDKEKVKTLLNMMGVCDEVDEKYMDAITAVSGSGPGYMSIIIEALTYAGLKVGLPRNIALKCRSSNRDGNRQTCHRPKRGPSKNQRHDHHARRNNHRSHLPNRAISDSTRHDTRHRRSHQKKPSHPRKTKPHIAKSNV